jgi:photosystem II stability/assembly factor-like uncharacterized protein
MHFVSPNDGWAVVRKDYTSLTQKTKPKNEDSGWFIYQTHDAGQNYTALDKKRTRNIRFVSFADANTGWALDEDNSILKTTDGGQNWQVQRKAGMVEYKDARYKTTPVQKLKEPLQAVVVGNANTAFAYGGGFHGEGVEQEGILLGTTDGGATWQKLPFLFQQNVKAVYFLDGQHGWVYDNGGSLYRTTDGGHQWIVVMPGKGTAPLIGMFFISSDEGWVVGKSGDLRHTTDGGKTWQAQKPPVQNTLQTVYFVDKNNGWAAGADGVMIGTSDGGAHWYKQDSDTPDAIAHLQFIDPQTGWAASQNGFILKYDPPK